MVAGVADLPPRIRLDALRARPDEPLLDLVFIDAETSLPRLLGAARSPDAPRRTVARRQRPVAERRG